MEFEEWEINKIIPYENNPRKNKDAVEKTAMSIEQYGWQQPIVVDRNGVVIVGHTRLKAAKKLKLKTCPVITATKLTEAQVKAYRIADNKTGEIATWDENLLELEIKELVDMDFDVELTGFEIDDFSLDLKKREDVEKIEYNDSNCELPIVPDFFEQHNCFIIVTHNIMDENFVRASLGLNENHVSLSGDQKNRKTNVVDVETLRNLWKK